MEDIKAYKIDKQHIFWQILRLMPILIVFYCSVNFVINPSEASLFLLVIIIYDKILNASLKAISEYIYDLVDKESIFIIGRGKRPLGAANTSCLLRYPEKESVSYGMPSGHSQQAWLFATYLILSIYNKHITLFKNSIELNTYIKYINIAVIIVIATLVSISRVLEKCHTIQQVIIGGIIGSSVGYFTYYISNKIEK